LSELLAIEPVAITDAAVASHLIPTSFGPRILFGPQKLDEFRELDAGRIGAIVGRLVGQADYVVVDLPAQAGPAHETVVKNSSIVLLLLEPEMASVTAASMRLRQIEAWGVSNSMIKPLVVNRQGAMMLSLREMENRLGRAIDGVVPPATEALNIAVQYGNPLVLFQPDHVASLNLADLVTRLAEKPVTLPR
jgi:Flp pilus assembly CpaE family ATPase